ncbi:hydroxyisourate hydrolase [Catenulispora sp. NF23]|uniref:Hydroxyisourate hydrolase n=1 Tax=Catenulispora pinistramenti TaxID=2705254 RepID=A0ABS5KM88_9ACTN|nr:hydroxyisourate hydrolase [Catenulispora pinistramenti]MBS2532131.1 hydroxyisourate hydrolase [Catenulispora pinistramenti]MBS2547173.1 hydroxyisourate hydrolase [Catenulispora pinistramenti]
MKLSVHVIDSAFGLPAAEVRVVLRRVRDTERVDLATGLTGSDGRLLIWEGDPRGTGTYELDFDLDGYYATTGNVSLFPRALLQVRITEATESLHIPLLIAPYLMLSYRGSAQHDVLPALGAAISGAQADRLW